jgi:WD40 repeat protein
MTDPILPLPGHTGSVRSGVFSPDGRTLASGNTIKLWDSASGELLRTIKLWDVSNVSEASK